MDIEGENGRNNKDATQQHRPGSGNPDIRSAGDVLVNRVSKSAGGRGRQTEIVISGQLPPDAPDPEKLLEDYKGWADATGKKAISQRPTKGKRGHRY